MIFVPVEPTGRMRSMAFVDGPGHHAFEAVEVPTFPPSPEADKLRLLRQQLGLSFREAAKALECSAVDYCDLEHGRRKPLHGSDWRELARVLREAKRRP